MTPRKEHPTYQPRYDFGTNTASDDVRTGTIKQLLEELNYECVKTTTGTYAKNSSNKNGTRATYKSLDGTLAFIEHVTGHPTPRQMDRVPITLLKLVKLLYVTNDTSDTHLFRLLKAPHMGGRASMEFYSSETPSRNQKSIAIVNHLLLQLALEVDPDVLRRINTSFLTYSKLLECIARESMEILLPIYAKHCGNKDGITTSLDRLTTAISKYTPKHHKSNRPAHEAVYTYLRILPFLNFVSRYKDIIELSKLDRPVVPISHKIEEFCENLSIEGQQAIHRDTPVISIEGLSKFVSSHTLLLSNLIKNATSITSQKQDIIKAINPCRKVLCAYVFHEWGDIPLNRCNISVSDCIAALCTIRHQQKVKTNFSPYWFGCKQADTGTGILTQMKKTRDCEDLFEDDYIPHGINQVLFSRFSQFYAAINGQTIRHHAWMNLQLARLTKYAQCYQSNDVHLCDLSVSSFQNYCMEKARMAANSIPIE